MKCKYCNAMNPDGMPVCLYCARPLVEIDQKEKKEEIQEEIKKDPIPTPPPKKMKIPVNTPVVNETVQPEIHNETVELLEALEATGWAFWIHWLTPLQVELIEKYLGEP